MSNLSTTNPRPLTIWTALCYITLMVAGPIGLLYMPEQIVVANDASQTALNLKNNWGIFHLGFIAQVVIVITEVIVTALIYVLMRPAGRTLAIMAVIARLLMTAVMSTNLMALLLMAETASGASYLAVFTPAQLDALTLFMFQFHDAGTIVWQILFAFHMLLLGVLVYRSGYLPRLFGIALVLGSPGYVFSSFGLVFDLSDFASYALATNVFLGASAIGEVGFGLWLLFKGVHKEKWQALAE